MQIEIKQITPDKIHLLVDDVEVAIDRAEYEAYIAPTGKYQWGLGEDLHEMTLDEYWADAKNSKPHAEDLNDYIAKHPAIQVAIKRASVEQFIRYELNQDSENSILLIMSMIDGYALKTGGVPVVKAFPHLMEMINGVE